MSDPRTRPISVAGPPPDAGPATATGEVESDAGNEVLVRASGVELLGEVPGSG